MEISISQKQYDKLLDAKVKGKSGYKFYSRGRQWVTVIIKHEESYLSVSYQCTDVEVDGKILEYYPKYTAYNRKKPFLKPQGDILSFEETFNDIYHLKTKWSDSEEGKKSSRYEGHFSVKLYMGSAINAALNWDIKQEDFKAVKEKFILDGRKEPSIVNTGMSSHNTMCFQYVNKKDCQYCYDVLKTYYQKDLLENKTNHKYEKENHNPKVQLRTNGGY